MANSEWRERHNIDEKLVLIAKSDLDPSSNVVSLLMGWSIDYDFIMVNQVMFTFRRENGYMVNNSTSEEWLWHSRSFSYILLNPTFDFKQDYLTCFFFTLFVKVFRLATAAAGFMLLSFINGLIVRIALMCSNVVIFPLIWLVKNITG